MKTTIDAAGRIVIPSDIRTGAGLTPGTVVEIELRDGTVVIEPAVKAVKIVKKGRLHVAVTEDEDSLPEDTVRKTRDELRGRS